jgi:hypothetical protein
LRCFFTRIFPSRGVLGGIHTAQFATVFPVSPASSRLIRRAVTLAIFALCRLSDWLPVGCFLKDWKFPVVRLFCGRYFVCGMGYIKHDVHIQVNTPHWKNNIDFHKHGVYYYTHE